MLAEHRLKADTRVGEISFPVALDADPMLGSAARSLILARRRNIVLRMASDHARFASGAAVKVYYQSPLMSHTIIPAFPPLWALFDRVTNY